jgi:putative transposase
LRLAEDRNRWYPEDESPVVYLRTADALPPLCCDSHQRTSQAHPVGYRTFRCQSCARTFNERTGTPFNYLTFPTDIVLQVVLWRLRYKLSFRDLAEMFLERGFVFTHEAVREWEARFAPLLADQLRTQRQGQAGRSWYVDETYVKVNGVWCYLYRAIDRDGNLVNSMLSATRDMNAAQRFFRQAQEVVGQVPERVTTDGHTSYPRAIRETLGEEIEHRCNQYLNNRLEQDHRGIKQRYYPMRGFGSFEAAARFCGAFDELRQFEGYRRTRAETGSLAERRQRFLAGTAALQALIVAA